MEQYSEGIEPGPAPEQQARPIPSIDPRRRLLEGAARVFAHRGLSRASVEAILRASGLGRGTFYRHFSNLEDVFMEVKQEAADRLFERVAAQVTPLENPADRLRVGIAAYVDAIAVPDDFVRVLYAERPSLDPHRALRRQTLDQFVALFRAGLVAAHEQGNIAMVPDDLTIFTVVAGLEAVAIRIIEEGCEHSHDDLRTSMTAVCIRALCVPVQT